MARTTQLRIASLLTRTADLVETKSMLGPLDLLSGALCSLQRADALGYRHRTAPLGKSYPMNLSARLRRIATGTISEDELLSKLWFAGFHMNSGLMRIAAAYHTSLKVLVGRPNSRKWIHQLRPKIRPALTSAETRCLDQVNEEVNRLKHEPIGVVLARTVDLPAAINAATELVELIETRGK